MIDSKKHINKKMQKIKCLLNEELNAKNIFTKAENYLREYIFQDIETLKEIFDSSYNFIDKNNLKKYFELVTVGIDIVKNMEPELLRYKVSYHIFDHEENLLKNYYIFFDEFGQYLDDFFD